MDTQRDPINDIDLPEPILERSSEVTVQTGTASLPIDDTELADWIKKRTKEHEDHLKNKLHLDERRKLNREFWLGKHYGDKEADMMANNEDPYKDPVIHQNTENRIAIASGRLPDIMVTPPDDSNESLNDAQDFQKALRHKVKNRVTRRIVKGGLRHMLLDFIGVIKFRWDPNLNGGDGDFLFELVRPDRIILDHTATIPDNGFTADNMDFIAEWIEEPLGVVLAKFPGKSDELLARLTRAKKPTDRVGKLKYQESHFTWYDKDGKIYEGVSWSYEDLVLDKQKEPNYDWEGYDRVVVNVKENGSFAKKTKVDHVYYNYFDRPRKPYIFFSYETLGEGPYEATTIVEQGVPLNRQINKRGRQTNKINDYAVPRMVFAGKFITKDQARAVSSDPGEPIWLDKADDASKAFTTSISAPASPELMQDMASNRNRLDAIFATHGTTRGETIPDGESGLSKQITREGDLAMSDDMVDIVVERVMYEIACWAVQMMKLNYDQDHFVRAIGPDGNMINAKLHRDNIADGLNIDVEATSVDKQTRRSDAMNLASRKAIDPLTMFEDLDMPNPKERLRRWAAFTNGTNDAFASYLAEVKIEFEHQKDPATDMQTNPVNGEANADASQAQQDIEALASGQNVDPPKSFDATYVQTFMEFVQSGQFEQLPEDVQGKVKGFITKLQAAAQSMEAPGAVAPQLAPTVAPMA